MHAAKKTPLRSDASILRGNELDAQRVESVSSAASPLQRLLERLLLRTPPPPLSEPTIQITIRSSPSYCPSAWVRPESGPARCRAPHRGHHRLSQSDEAVLHDRERGF